MGRKSDAPRPLTLLDHFTRRFLLKTDEIFDISAGWLKNSHLPASHAARLSEQYGAAGSDFINVFAPDPGRAADGVSRCLSGSVVIA